MSEQFQYFAQIGALLFPCLSKADAGGKEKAPNTPLFQRTTGKARPSFAGGDASGNPIMWGEWFAAEPALGMWAGGSRLIVVDIDTKAGREVAWSEWQNWCNQHNLPVYMPQVQTPSGGWHVYFKVPDGIDATTLHQPDLVRVDIEGKRAGIINVRAGNGYVLVPPSQLAKGAYIFLSADLPYPAPDALLKHCSNVDNQRLALPVSAATFDPSLYTSRDREIARLKFLADVAVFAKTTEGGRNQELNNVAYRNAGSVRAGLLDATEYEQELIKACADNGLLADDGDEQCLKTIISAIGGAERQNVAPYAAKPVSQVFAGLDLTGAAKPPEGANPLFGQTAQYIADLGAPILEDVLSGLPTSRAMKDHPTLPDEMRGHPLYETLCEFLSRMFSLVETFPGKSITGQVAPALGVLCVANETVFEAVCRRLYALGARFDEARIRFSGKQFADKVQREMLALTGWQANTRGEPESDNPDNVRVLLRMLGCEVRYNAWSEQNEIRGAQWPEWTQLDEPIFARLRTIAAQTGNRFTPGVDFLWSTLGDIAQENAFDPAISFLALAETTWDGKARLDTWLETYCHQYDPRMLPYMRAVSANVIGGLVKRIREPGCKHDEMLILMGAQGLGKSTLCRALAINDDWFSDEVLLGDASKELVLILRGKSVIEIGELDGMGRRDTATVKAMLSRQVDRGRPAYSRMVQTRPRRCIFVATCNDETPLQDDTGNRRYLPVKLTVAPDVGGLRAALPQLIGEACARHSKGERFHIPPEVWNLTREAQEAVRATPAYETTLEAAFGRKDRKLMQQGEYVTAGDLVLFAQMRRFSGHPRQWGAVMRALGFTPIQIGPERLRAWLRGPRDGSLQWVLAHSPVGGASFVLRGETQVNPATIIPFPAVPGLPNFPIPTDDKDTK